MMSGHDVNLLLLYVHFIKRYFTANILRSPSVVLMHEIYPNFNEAHVPALIFNSFTAVLFVAFV